MKKRNQKKYEKYMNEQLEILKGHFERCMLRVHNYYHKLEGENEKRRAG